MFTWVTGVCFRGPRVIYVTVAVGPRIKYHLFPDLKMQCNTKMKWKRPKGARARDINLLPHEMHFVDMYAFWLYVEMKRL